MDVLCGCGKPGCIETFVSGPGIARAGQKAFDNGNYTSWRNQLVKRKSPRTMSLQQPVKAIRLLNQILDDCASLLRSTWLG